MPVRFKTAARKATGGLIYAAEVAVQMAPNPNADVVLNVVKQVVATCDGLKVHKDKAKDLSDLVQQLKKIFIAHQKEIERTMLASSVEQVLSTLEDVREQLLTFASYRWWQAMLFQKDIAQGLLACRTKIDDQLQQFNFAQNCGMITELNETARTEDLTIEKQAEISEQLHNLTELSYRPDNELRLPTGQPVTRTEFEAVWNHMSSIIEGVYERTGQRPLVKDLTLEVAVQQAANNCLSCEAHADVYVGYWLKDKKVAVKKLRMIKSQKEKNVLRFLNAFKTSLTMKSHPNVLPLLGIIKYGGDVSLVTPYMPNGNIRTFCKGRDVDPLRILIGAASGVTYLHKINIIHGNLKASNVLINEKFEAVISDFEMAKVVTDIHIEMNTHDTMTRTPSLRWAPPELGETSKRMHPKTDSWGFGLVMVEAFTGAVPWPELRRHETVHIGVTKKENPLRPLRPDTDWVTDLVWEVIQGCCTWFQERLEMNEVERRLRVAEEDRNDNPPPSRAQTRLDLYDPHSYR